MKRKQIYAYALTALLTAQVQVAVKAQTGPINVATTAVPFLRIQPDARSGGMGDVGLATSADANSSLLNLAKTPFATSKSAIGATYTPWMKDVASNVYLATLAGYHQLDDEQAIAASVRYFNIGDISITDYSGNKLQSATPHEFSVDLGYSRKLSKVLSLGAALRYISSSLATGEVNGSNYKAGTAFAADLSVYYNGLNQEGSGWSGGVVLSNLGSKIGYTDDATAKNFIPANLGVGVAYTSVLDKENSITVSADVNKLLVPKTPTDPAAMEDYYKTGIFESWSKSFNSGNYQFGIGGEYTYNKLFSLRAGYHYGNKNDGNQRYFTAGAGLQWDKAVVNFSYLAGAGNGATRDPLSNTIRLGVGFTLGK